MEKDKMVKALEEKFNSEVKIIERDGNFDFKCDACGHCCMNRSGGGEIILSPFDIFNLAKGLGISIENVLKKHARFNLGSNSGLPLFTLYNKEVFGGGDVCTFLRYKDGKRICSVHDFKPAVCSLFPLGRVTKSMTDIKYILQTDGCGNNNKKGIETHTVNEWVSNIDDSDKAFRLHNDFIKNVFDTMNISKFIDSEEVSDSIKNMFLGFYITIIYTRYDMSKSFFEQFEKNAKEMEEILKYIVSGNHDHDEKIISKFKDFDTKADAYLKLLDKINSVELISSDSIKTL